MKLGPVRLTAASVALLLIQLGLVSSIAAKYAYQRWTCPRVWTRTIAIDPESPMRGRYLSLQVTVDGCRSTLPSAKQAAFPRNIDGTVNQLPYAIASPQPVQFPAELTVQGGKLVAIRIPTSDGSAKGRPVLAFPGSPCAAMRLADPVNFYIAEHAISPLPLKRDAELWIEVTIPPQGPPRPLQLALKQDGTWKPLGFQ
jgi:hypothetical protein